MRSRLATLAVLCLIALGSAPAAAQRSYSVRMTSEPEGAKIFLEDPDSEPIGETPFDGDLPAGTHNLIITARGHETAIESIRVKRSRRRQRFNFILEKKPVAYLTLRPSNEGDDFDGATILIDDEERQVEIGEKLEVAAGPHKVEVIKSGFKNYESYLEVEEGATYGVQVNFVPDTGDSVKTVVVEDDDGDAPDEDDAPGEPAKVQLLTAWGGFEWGGRDFKYDDASMNLRDYNFLGARFRAGMVVHPLVSFGRWAGGLGIGGDVGFLIGPRTSTNDNGTPDDASDDLQATNSWFDYSVDLRYRLDFAEVYWAAAAVGYGQNRFTFEEVDPGLEGDLAAVDYKALQYQVMGGAHLSGADLILGLKVYQIQEAGEVSARFTQSSISAFGVYAGASYPVYGKLELAGRILYDRYSYTLGEAPMGETYQADSAIDSIFGLTLGVGYRL